MIHLVDLSQWNTVDSYPELARAIAGAYVKATDAKRYATGWLPFTDPKHEAHTIALRAASVPTGSYCFGHPTQDVNQSADYFVQHAFFDQLRPCLDMESLADGKIPGNAGEWADAWLARVQANSGVSPIGYASTSYLVAMLGQCPALRDRDWWVAAYPGVSAPPTSMPHVPGLLASRVVAWQWSGSSALPGIDGNADRDVAPSLGPLYVASPMLDPGHERAGA